MKRDFRRWMREDARRRDYPKWQIWSARVIVIALALWLLKELFF
jgi:hypothetical protein